MKRAIGSILIIYAAMQSMPLFISNITVYISLYVLSMLFLLFLGYQAPNKNYFISFSVFWFFYGLVSYFWSIDSFLWFRNNMILFVILLSLLIFMFIIDCKEDIVFFSKVWALTAGIANIIGWYEIIFHHYYFTISPYTSHYAILKWPLFTFINVNDYSTYLSISIPIILVWVKNEERTLNKILGYLIVISTLLIQIFAVSRASILAIIIGFLFLYLLTHIKLTSTNILLLNLFFIIIFVGITFAYINGHIDKILVRFVYNNSRSDALRMDLIKNGLVYLKNSKYLGIGSGNVEYWLENFRYYNTAGMVYIHNWWVEVLVNFGVIVFIGYVIFWLKTLFMNIKMTLLLENRITKYLAMAVVVFFIAGISSSSILLMKWLPVFTGFIVSSTLYVNENMDISNVKE